MGRQQPGEPYTCHAGMALIKLKIFLIALVMCLSKLILGNGKTGWSHPSPEQGGSEGEEAGGMSGRR